MVPKHNSHQDHRRRQRQPGGHSDESTRAPLIPGAGHPTRPARYGLVQHSAGLIENAGVQRDRRGHTKLLQCHFDAVCMFHSNDPPGTSARNFSMP